MQVCENIWLPETWKKRVLLQEMRLTKGAALKTIHATRVRPISPQPLPHLYTSYLTAAGLQIKAATCLQTGRAHSACHNEPRGKVKGTCSTPWGGEYRLEKPTVCWVETCKERNRSTHSLHRRNWAHNARKRPRLRPSYITWNPSVLLQCICTLHSHPPPPPFPSTTLIPANVTWKGWHRDTNRNFWASGAAWWNCRRGFALVKSRWTWCRWLPHRDW